MFIAALTTYTPVMPQLFPFVPTTVIDPKLTNFRIFQRSTLASFDSTVQSHEDCGLFIIINTHIFSDLKKITIRKSSSHGLSDTGIS